MKAVIQRVKNASVTIAGKKVSEIGTGFFILLGVVDGDTEKEALLLAQKTANLRIFCDSEDKMNLSLLQTEGSALVVSQFTLCADTKKGNRPSFINAMAPDRADALYHLYMDELKNLGVKDVESGEFGADMLCGINNDGPVTIILDTDTWKR